LEFIVKHVYESLNQAFRRYPNHVFVVGLLPTT